ncbi:nickel ABC transporter, ATP-binding protein [Escherichia coli]|nr:nickel ABC transporter, ATP-binding protein [Escherichia coli]
MTLLNVSDLSHHYAHGGFSGKHQHQAVLNNVSLTLKSGETVALLGRSGCGKKHSLAATGRLRIALTGKY